MITAISMPGPIELIILIGPVLLIALIIVVIVRKSK